MKKSVATLVALLLVLGMAFSAAAQEQVTIRFAHGFDVTERANLDRVIEVFEAQHPHIKIDVVNLSANVEQALAMAVSGTLPDVFSQGEVFLGAFADFGAVYDLNTFIQSDPDGKRIIEDTIPGVRQQWTESGHVWALPFDSNVQALFYNKELFDAAGMSYPTSDWTWDDFAEAAKALTHGQGRNKQYGAMIETGWWSFPIWLYQNEARVLSPDSTRSELNSPNAIEALQFVADLINVYEVAPSPQAISGMGMGSDTLFMSGRVAMWPTGWWNTMVLADDPPFDWGVVELPSNRQKGSQFHYNAYMIPKSTKHPDEAWTFLKWLAGPEADRLQLEYMGVGLPTQMSVIEDADLHPVAAASLTHAYPFPVTSKWPEVSDLLDAELAPLWDGSESAEVVLNRVSQMIDRILAE